MTDRNSPKVHRDPPSQPPGWVDPDPLYVAPQPVRRTIRQVDQPPPHWFAWFGLGVCVGIIVLAFLIVLGRAVFPAPRSAAVIPSGGTSEVLMTASATPTGAGQRQTGAPVSAVGGPASPTPDLPAGAPTPTGAVGSALIGGWATWYDVGPGFYAAAGPVLREALGPGWRNELVEVVTSGRPSVIVEIVDFCACGERGGIPTILDLSPDAFEVLAPLSQGTVRVSIEIPGAGVTLPPTDDQSGEDPSPHPDDERMRDEVRGDELYR